MRINMHKLKRAGRSQPLCNRQNRKPGSVLICHLSSQPTPWQRAGSPFDYRPKPPVMPVYMVLLDLVPSPPYVTIRRRELLPHGFTLTLAGGLFSVTAFIRLLPSVLSTAGRPFQSGLSSAGLSRPRQVIPPILFQRTICIRAYAPSHRSVCSSSRLP